MKLNNSKLDALLQYKPDYKVLHFQTGSHTINKNLPRTSPIILVDNEFLQVYSGKGNTFKVLRGLWGSRATKHVKGSVVSIFPYQQLDKKIFEKIKLKKVIH